MDVLKERRVLFNSIYEVGTSMCYMRFLELGLFMGRMEKAFVLVYPVIIF